MDEELRKRLEEEYGCPIMQISQEEIDHFLWLEDRKKESYILGYKEAITQAKEWLGNVSWLTDFEVYMYKLLEENKYSNKL